MATKACTMSLSLGDYIGFNGLKLASLVVGNFIDFTFG